MSKWQHRISIKAINDHYDKHQDIQYCGRTLAGKLREAKSKFLGGYSRRILENLADAFENIEDPDQYDSYLDELYDWADEGSRCWIDPFK